MVSTMNRGDIYFISLDPTVGHEIRKSRPCVIVSSDANNDVRQMITVVPLTSNLTRTRRIEVAIPKDRSGLPKDSKALVPQMRGVSCMRISGARVGSVHSDLMAEIDLALKRHLDLD
jgi:mRNA interferase MazF